MKTAALFTAAATIAYPIILLGKMSEEWIRHITLINDREWPVTARKELASQKTNLFS